MATSYWDYLRIEELLGLQAGVEGNEDELGNDEVLFIVVHQIHELWFKLVLRDLESCRDLFCLDPVPEDSLAAASRRMRRVSHLFRTAGNHFSVMETMTTRDFLDFRDKLVPASGFQSAQFREIEILLGLGERVRLGNEASYLDALKNPDGSSSPTLQRVETRIQQEMSLKDAVGRWLHRTPIEGSMPGDPNDEKTVEEFLGRFLESHRKSIEEACAGAETQSLGKGDFERLQERYQQEVAQAEEFFLTDNSFDRRVRAAALFIENYRDLPLLAWPREVLDLIIEMEQGYLIFRQRHARMVERMIGRRVGTGGSDGVSYLDRTALEYRIFPDLWQVRTLLLEKRRIPELRNREFYRFHSDS